MSIAPGSIVTVDYAYLGRNRFVFLGIEDGRATIQSLAVGEEVWTVALANIAQVEPDRGECQRCKSRRMMRAARQKRAIRQH